MKRYLFGAMLVLVGLTLLVGAAVTQPERAQIKPYLQASDGSGPIPTCRPGTNCNPDDQLRQVASDGSGPIPTCRPGTNCKPDDQMRQMASEIGQTRKDSAYSLVN